MVTRLIIVEIKKEDSKWGGGGERKETRKLWTEELYPHVLSCKTEQP
jgi:hypothetical protein